MLRARAREPRDLPVQATEGESDEELYERAMRDVVRAHWRHPAAATPVPTHQPAQEAGQGDERLMMDALEGNQSPRISNHPEYIEGWIGVTGRLFLSRLRNGTYSIQGQLDLHGLGRAEARETVEEYIRSMSRFRSCCVKIIHGRGVNSPDQKAVIKSSLQHWLTTRRMSRHVIAYASAPATDGGVGAVYVLLKCRRHSK